MRSDSAAFDIRCALMGAVMFFYRITDERYRQIRAQILSDAPAA